MFLIPAEDSFEKLKWASKNSELINGNDFKAIVGGDSAGGNLATVVTMMARDRKGPAIYAQVLLYPVTNLSCDTESYYEFAERLKESGVQVQYEHEQGLVYVYFSDYSIFKERIRGTIEIIKNFLREQKRV